MAYYQKSATIYFKTPHFRHAQLKTSQRGSPERLLCGIYRAVTTAADGPLQKNVAYYKKHDPFKESQMLQQIIIEKVQTTSFILFFSRLFFLAPSNVKGTKHR